MKLKGSGKEVAKWKLQELKLMDLIFLKIINVPFLTGAQSHAYMFVYGIHFIDITRTYQGTQI